MTRCRPDPSGERRAPRGGRCVRPSSRPRYGCMKRLAVYLLCGVAGLYIAILAAYWFSPVRRWETVGPVQVLTNGKETCVFFQFDTWERRPGLLISSPNVVTGKRQGVVEIRDGGAKG